MTDDEILEVFRLMGMGDEEIERFELLLATLDPKPPVKTWTSTNTREPEPGRCSYCGQWCDNPPPEDHTVREAIFQYDAHAS